MFGAIILTIYVSVATADEISANIMKVEGDKVTFTKLGNKPFDAVEKEKTLPVKADAKITKMRLNKESKKTEAGEPIEGGLKNDVFTKIGKDGIFARITTDADNKKITAISTSGSPGFGGGFGGKGKKKDAGNP